jgi:hypothetical protein
VLARLPADAITTHAEAFARYILKAAERTNSPLDLVSLAKSLRSIGRYLPAGDKQAEVFASVLFRFWDEAPEETLTEQIGEAMQAVAPLLPARVAGRCADHIHAALQKADSGKRKLLVEVHEALIKPLPEDQARPRRVAAILTCIHGEVLGDPPSIAWRRPATPATRSELPSDLLPVVAGCTSHDLVEVLRSPACTGDVQVWFLGELSRRSRCDFRSVWDVVNWLERANAREGKNGRKG